MKLLNELADDHAAITGMLEQVVALGIITNEAQATLRLIRSRMLSHLKKENEEFYPLLRKAAVTDKGLEKMLNASGRDLEAVSAMAFRFFDKYSTGGNNREFARELGMLYGALRDRIQREEQTLFGEYEKRARDVMSE